MTHGVSAVPWALYASHPSLVAHVGLLGVQAKYIIVRNNGTLAAGNETRPYPGPSAKITLTAQPHVDLELPLYGSKVGVGF